MMNCKHILVSTLLTLLNIVPFSLVKDKLPNMVPVHWDFHGNVNGELSKNAFVYGVPCVMAIINLLVCFFNQDKLHASNIIYYYLTPMLCFVISLIMLFLALK